MSTIHRCHCGKGFIKNKHNQKHCSEKCRNVQTVKDCKDERALVKEISLRLLKGKATYGQLNKVTKHIPRLVAYSRRILAGAKRI